MQTPIFGAPHRERPKGGRPEATEIELAAEAEFHRVEEPGSTTTPPEVIPSGIPQAMGRIPKTVNLVDLELGPEIHDRLRACPSP